MRNFKELSDSEKVRAVLATVHEPVTKEMVFDFAGIDTATLQEEQQKELEGLVNSTRVDQPEGYQGPEKYWFPLETQQSVIEGLGIDGKSVHARIAEVLMKDLGLDLRPEKRG